MPFSSVCPAIVRGGKMTRTWSALRQRFASLSPREREIVIQVARGRLSKQIAHDIGIAEATVKVHRSRAMQKMQARFASRTRPDG